VTTEALLAAVTAWADDRADIEGIILVGSHARGTPRPDSDVDLVLLSLEPAQFIRDVTWVATFGDVLRSQVEDWGKLQSIRVFYAGGLEVEFGVASVDWVNAPLDAGTAQVLSEGMRILLDRTGRLTQNLRTLAPSHPTLLTP
jgi:predicted nucleotidyltransferase